MSAIVLSQPELDDLAALGRALVDSGYFADATKVAQAAVKVLAGREIGLGPIAAMRSFHVIDGKVGPTSELLAALVKAHPTYDYRVRELTNERCEIAFFEAGEAIGTATFDQDDVKRAGLGKKSESAWNTFPRSMLFARALSQGVGFFCPDVAYTQQVPDLLSADEGLEGLPVQMPGDPATSGEENARASLMPESPIAYGEGAGSDASVVAHDVSGAAATEADLTDSEPHAAASEPQDPEGEAAGIPSPSTKAESSGSSSSETASNVAAVGADTHSATVSETSEASTSDTAEIDSPDPVSADGTAAASSGSSPDPLPASRTSPDAVDDAGAVPPDLRPALWEDLERECLQREVSRIKILAQTAGRTVRLTAKPEDFTVAELEAAIAAVGGATVSA